VGRRGGTVFKAGRMKSLGCCEKEEGSGRAVSLRGQSMYSKRRTKVCGVLLRAASARSCSPTTTIVWAMA